MGKGPSKQGTRYIILSYKYFASIKNNFLGGFVKSHHLVLLWKKYEKFTLVGACGLPFVSLKSDSLRTTFEGLATDEGEEDHDLDEKSELSRGLATNAHRGLPPVCSRRRVSFDLVMPVLESWSCSSLVLSSATMTQYEYCVWGCCYLGCTLCRF